MSDTIRIALSGVTIQDIARALEFTGLAVSNTFDPQVFVINPAPRILPPNVVPFERSAFHEKQI
jgi:hypothetical protein